MPHIRIANLSDALDVAELAESTFRDTFASQNTMENMNLHCASSYGEEIQAGEIASSDYTTLVVEHSNRLVAYAQLRWQKPPQCIAADSPGEIHRIYVNRDWHGKGLARDLMSSCLDKMQERDTDVVWLGVWEKNPRALSFYKKFSFSEVGSHIYPVGHDPQRDIILARPVPPQRHVR